MADHKLYRERSKDLGAWLAKAKDRFADNADTSGTRQELEERKERIQVCGLSYMSDIKLNFN